MIELISVGMIFLLVFIMYIMMYVSNAGNFRVTFPIMIKRISYKKFGIIILKIIGVLTFFYLAGGVELDVDRLLTFLSLFVGLLLLVILGIISNINQNYKLCDMSKTEIRKEKLIRLKRQRFIYKIKNIFR